jgi:hypothetical protein
MKSSNNLRKKLFRNAIFIISFLLVPTIAKADVRINEVDWMGTEASQ